MILSLNEPETGMEDFQDHQKEALEALGRRDDWVIWAEELVPDFISLSDARVGNSMFSEQGTARGVICDLLSAVKAEQNDRLMDRAFEFVLRCAHSDDGDLYGPATIGFLCKVCRPVGAEGSYPMHLEELASRLSDDDLDAFEPLFRLHYGDEGVATLRASKSGRALN